MRFKALSRLSAVQLVAIVILILGVVFSILGFLRDVTSYTQDRLVEDVANLLTNWGTEAIGIAITVLLIDWLYDRQNERHEKRDLILQMGSPDSAFALEAVRKLRLRGWLKDGSLKGAELNDANLRNADLTEANLSGVRLLRADLSHSNLWGANLDGAVLAEADLSNASLGIFIRTQDDPWLFIRSSLQGTDLRRANLRNARLIGADLRNANLRGAQLSGAILDDSSSDEQIWMRSPILDEPVPISVPFISINLSGIDLREATYDSTTIWPKDFVPPPEAIKVNEDQAL